MRGGDVLGASDVLRNTGRDGWVKREDHDRAMSIVDRLAPAPLVRREWAARLLAHPRRVDKELAASILAPLARTHAREVHRAFERLVQDEDPAVRCAGARLARPLLEEGLGALRMDRLDETALQQVRALVEDPSPIVRQVARSTMKAVIARRPDLAEPLGVSPAQEP